MTILYIQVHLNYVGNLEKLNYLLLGPVVSLFVRLRAEVNLVSEVLPVSHHEVTALRNHRLHANVTQDPPDEVPLAGQVDGDGPKVALGGVEARHFELEGPSDCLLDRGRARVHTVLMDNLKYFTEFFLNCIVQMRGFVDGESYLNE